MSHLFNAYQNRVGRKNVRRQGNGYNGPCPLCGGEHRSDRFMVWPDRDDRLGETCAQHSVKGIWYCRRCGKTGDTIAYLMEVEGLTFKAAVTELSISPGQRKHAFRRTPTPPKTRKTAFVPTDWPLKATDPVTWQAYASTLLDESLEGIKGNSQALAWLARRGLEARAVKKYRIGYLPEQGHPTGRIRPRQALGLGPKFTGDREKKHIFIPRGIVIPHFSQDGSLLRLRFRRPKADVAQWGEKYLVLEGSSSQPMLLRASGPGQLAAYITVEAELCALLIHHISDESIGAFAALTNRGKPDTWQHPILEQAAVNLIALDFDPRFVRKPGSPPSLETPGGQGWLWWRATYRNARCWPVPCGKDPGEAFAQGLNIRDWITAGLPPSIRLPAPGSGAGPKTPYPGPLTRLACTTPNGCLTPHGKPAAPRPGKLPSCLTEENVPGAVLYLYERWSDFRSLSVIKRDDGSVAFNYPAIWEWPQAEYALARKKVAELQNAILGNETIWHWLTAVNPHRRITAGNLFHICGEPASDRPPQAAKA